jgi:hypothetical protein
MKTTYKQLNQKNNMLASAKELIKMFREDNYLDEDSYFVVKYNNGKSLSYPVQAEQIKFKNITNIYFSGTDDNGDFNHDFIGTQETFDFITSINNFELKNPLIVEDMENYFKTF